MGRAKANKQLEKEYQQREQRCINAGGHWWEPQLSSFADFSFEACAMCGVTHPLDPEDGPLAYAAKVANGIIPYERPATSAARWREDSNLVKWEKTMKERFGDV